MLNTVKEGKVYVSTPVCYVLIGGYFLVFDTSLSFEEVNVWIGWL
jgi:hypothetical protein